MNDNHPYKTVASKVVYENPWIRVREDKIIRPDGKEGIYGVMERWSKPCRPLFGRAVAKPLKNG